MTTTLLVVASLYSSLRISNTAKTDWGQRYRFRTDKLNPCNGSKKSKNPPASNRITEIIADHKNSMNPDQTVRPARSMTPLFGPIAYRIIPIIKNDQYLKPYIEQGPDLKNRLTIVLEFMNNPMSAA